MIKFVDIYAGAFPFAGEDFGMVNSMVLHEGSVAELKTGEGKTLMSTLAAYLCGAGVSSARKALRRGST